MANGGTASGGGSGGEEETAMTPIPPPSAAAGQTAVPPAGNNQGCNSIDILDANLGQILRQVLGQVLMHYKDIYVSKLQTSIVTGSGIRFWDE